jgi:hypothetical protein
VISALALGLLGLLAVDVPGDVAAVDSHTAALVAVALPANANRAIIEALNRLRGEATSVGFEVRFIDASTESMTLTQLDSLSRGLRPAAVVAFAGSQEEQQSARSLDVWFLDRATGRTSVAHLTAGESTDSGDRADVILAVRAVDFIRARMFDTLATRQAEPAKKPPEPVAQALPRLYLAVGLGILADFSGFQPALAPQLEAGYPLRPWARLSVMALGFGSRAAKDTTAGQVSLDQRLVEAALTLVGPTWHGLRPAVEVGGAEYFALVRGEAKQSQTVGQDVTVSSHGAVVALGVSVAIVRHLDLVLRSGTLWLQNRPQIYGTADAYLGNVGGPTWFSSACLGLTL